ncbi:autotransporter outer membrane beta-barrel domain-containing protein [Atlantibacter subterranea]|uniref:autotransporter outer membrane beta-barrel domain-containing protein n=1 Tax=Atlantibacter subterraneus TaxID=255519 RepID=UPI0020C37BDF|nr:autotransporter outer membrane beta-barrel domain-containing protein [Atlantibacter subterranea]UTJ48222.1 autotransporter outer membrane beta-barrel domain-containing protein [Atlantibacter subterranea]
MRCWNKKLVVSQLAIACTMAIASQASATIDISGTNYDTFYYNGGVMYQGYVGYDYGSNYYNGNIYPVINGARVNGVISTYYLDDGVAGNTNPNSLTIKDSYINGMITSECMTVECADGRADGYAYDRLALTVDNSTIDDNYEHYTYYNAGTGETASYDTFDLGTAITLDQEVDLVIQNNSKVAGIMLGQGYQWNDNKDITAADGWNNTEIFNDTVVVKDSVVTSGSMSDMGTEGFYGRTGKASDYSNGYSYNPDDVALAVIASGSDNAMQTTATFDHSTLTGDVLFSSTFDNNFGGYTTADGTHVDAYDRNGDGVMDSNGWDNTDRLDLTLTNGSKWVGAAFSNVEATAELYDYQPNSIWPSSVYGIGADGTAFDEENHVVGNAVYQSGIFNVTLDNGSEWDTRKVSNIDDLVVNNGSKVNVEDSSLLADSITLTNGSSLNIGDSNNSIDAYDLGYEVATNSLHIDSYSQASLLEETASLYANTITVDNHSQLNLGLGQIDTNNMVLTNAGVFDIASRDYVLNSDLNNGRYITNDIHDANYDYGVIALNSDGHLAVNGDVAGNYKVRIDNATGVGSEAQYKDKEIIRVYDNDANTAASFTAANKADLGAYTYEAQQNGDVVTLHQQELTDYANMALSVPSANSNIWNLEQDVLAARLTNGRHTAGDQGGAWVSYYGGSFSGSNNVLNYDQDVNGIMVGVDKQIDGNNAKWTVGAAAGFGKGSLDDRSGNVDQDTQSARFYTSARFPNNIFVDTTLSYSHYSNDLTSKMSNGDSVSGDISSDAWGFGLKAGYDWQFNENAYLTPYASITGLFQDGDDYQLSNKMDVGSQSYDSLRYELGADIGYTFNYGNDQSFTPYGKLAYVYDDAGNSANVNGDDIDNGVEGSAVRVGLGGQFNFTRNFSTYADANYLGGGDVDQDWAANVGVKYTW